MSAACMPAVIAALGAIQDQPRIACLVGDHGAALTWGDDGSEPDQVDQLIADDSIGRTWGTVPVGATFIQCDYEWPATPMRRLAGTHLVRWDRIGRCEILGPDAAIRARMASDLDRAEQPLPAPQLRTWTSVWDQAGHLARVRALQDAIAAGDCYQGNLGVPLLGELEPGPHRDLACFIALLARSPAAFAGFFRTPGLASVVSHSPECLVARRGGQAVSVPIKGTRKRLPGADARQRQELATSSKDAAELAMIVDLVRNDLGRVSRPGSVRVTDPGFLIDLPYVHHRAARIEAHLIPGTTDQALLSALFPAGSITGAPKRMAMEILAGLEDAARGPWCGTFGWTASAGCDLAVAIRTAAITGTRIRTAAGGGIVADSDPASEWAEAMAKASAMAAAWGYPS